MTLVRLARQKAAEERGIALVSVIAIGAIMAILATAAIAYSVGTVTKSRGDQDVSGALAAAYAGIEEYQSLLANNAAYVRYGNAASEYTNPPGRPTLASQVTAPTLANPAFGLGESGPWATVAGSNGTSQFRYEVNNSKFDSSGVVTLRSTGRVGDATRTLVADLRQDGFVAYVYFTDLETSDPNSDTSTCNRYAWANPARPTSCPEISFSGGDVIDGDVHSNDRIVICNATFKKAVTTEYNPSSGNAYKLAGTGCNPVFESGVPKYTKHIEMPPTNALLKKETRNDLTLSDVPNPGCLYTGPTSIAFRNDGTMLVKSPWTQKTQVTGDPATGGEAAPACGNVSELRTTGAVVPVPNNNVIYVQNVPASTTDPNYSASTPASVNCTEYSTGSGASKVTYLRNNGLGYPIANEAAVASVYGCKSGDLFVQGSVRGKVTVSAENFVYVTGNLTYADANLDVLGLVGQNAVYVWNPVDAANACLVAASNRAVQGAILSVAHTFTVQNYNRCGYRGELQVTGSIAQKYRGPVGEGTVAGAVTTITNGYKKKYLYDTRFRYTAPPKFLAPLSTTYGVTTFVEVEQAFNGDGTSR